MYGNGEAFFGVLEGSIVLCFKIKSSTASSNRRDIRIRVTEEIFFMEVRRSDINEWYTQKQVAERLGVSKATVYYYAKQGKIRKMADPHRLHREARYYKEEVDCLAREREQYATFKSGQTVGFICSKCL